VVIKKTYKTLCCQGGFSLIELMIALVISLFLIGGILSVFSSNQQTSQVKRDLDNAQEAFRFASFTIARIVKLGGGTNPSDPAMLQPSANDELIVSFLRRPGITDCLGLPAGGAGVAVNTFFVDAGALLCENDSGQIATLVSNIDSMEVRYGVPGTNQWIENNDFMLAAELEADSAMNWNDVTSAHIQLRMTGSGLETTFVAAARGKLIAQHGGGTVVDNEDAIADQEDGNDGVDEGSDDPNNDEQDNGEQPPIDLDSDEDSDQSGNENNEDGGSLLPPTGVSCSCSRSGNSSNYSLTGSNPTECSNQCCNDADNKCTDSNNCEFIAWCPTQ
jgi:prepilin-type N-terminal cleavage/methylation domain-containing protein